WTTRRRRRCAPGPGDQSTATADVRHPHLSESSRRRPQRAGKTSTRGGRPESPGAAARGRFALGNGDRWRCAAASGRLRTQRSNFDNWLPQQAVLAGLARGLDSRQRARGDAAGSTQSGGGSGELAALTGHRHPAVVHLRRSTAGAGAGDRTPPGACFWFAPRAVARLVLGAAARRALPVGPAAI